MIRVALLGFGYWGPNLARNFHSMSQYELIGIADLDAHRREVASRKYPAALVTANASELIESKSIDLVAVATPVSSHYELALAALTAGKHVFVEKPVSASVSETQHLVDEAHARSLVLMVDYTYLFSAPVLKIKELIRSGALGDIYYYDSIRVNLGIFQRDVDVIWDLAVHDFAIMDFLFEKSPSQVSAIGFQHVQKQNPNMAFISLLYSSGLVGHVNVNWLAPVKIRQTLIGGSKQMVVYDDLEPSEKIKIYDHGIDIRDAGQAENDSLYELLAGYRKGDITSPNLDATEALHKELSHLALCIKNRRSPINDGSMGVRVAGLVSAVQQSVLKLGSPCSVSDPK